MDLKIRVKQDLDRSMKRIADAAKNNNLAEINKESQRASRLKSILKDLKCLEKQHLETRSSRQILEKPKSSPRELRVTITQGMINQNLLTLTPYVKRGIIKTGEKLYVEAIPSGEKIFTKLLDQSNKLQERGAISRFYKEAEVKANDEVVLKEQKKGHWILRKCL